MLPGQTGGTENPFVDRTRPRRRVGQIRDFNNRPEIARLRHREIIFATSPLGRRSMIASMPSGAYNFRACEPHCPAIRIIPLWPMLPTSVAAHLVVRRTWRSVDSDFDTFCVTTSSTLRASVRLQPAVGYTGPKFWRAEKNAFPRDFTQVDVKVEQGRFLS